MMTGHLEFRRDAEGRPLWHAPLPHPSGASVLDGRPAFGPCQLCGEVWPCAEARYDAGPVPITGIWLRNGAGSDDLEVLAEVDGRWRTVIVESFGGPLSHIVEPLGIRHGKPDRLNDSGGAR